ncbi:hypothetical protein HL42_6692 [Trichophyton rubrum]|nr:hypothetical protein HL42_6692 [Trichophyton rubrum]
MDIMHALDALRNAPDDLLYAHGKEAILMVREVERRLQRVVGPDIFVPTRSLKCHSCRRNLVNNEDIPSSEVSIFGPSRGNHSVSPTDNRAQIAIDPQKSQHKGSTSGADEAQSSILFASLMTEITWIWKFVRKTPGEVIKARREQRPSDIRFNDIQRVEGNPNPTNEDRLFRGVAQRSLALQFLKFESQLLANRTCRRQGLIPTFVRNHLYVTNPKFAQQCIQAGQKQLRVEEALRSAMGQKEDPRAGTGISALTALTITPFKYLRLMQIPSFIGHLLLDSAKVDLPPRESVEGSGGPVTIRVHILDVLEHISKWFNDFQKCYDDISSARQLDHPILQEVDKARDLNGEAGNLPSTHNANPSDGEGHPGSVHQGANGIHMSTAADYDRVPEDGSSSDSPLVSETVGVQRFRTPRSEQVNNSTGTYIVDRTFRFGSSNRFLGGPLAASGRRRERKGKRKRNQSKHSGNENHVQASLHSTIIGPLVTAETEYQNVGPQAVIGTDVSNIVTETDLPREDFGNAMGDVSGMIPAHANYPSISSLVDSPPRSPALHSEVIRPPVSPIATPRHVRAPQNVSDTHNQMAGTLHNCGSQLDDTQVDNIAADQGRTRFNPLASDALFSLFPGPQANGIQFDNRAEEIEQERTRFNPLTSDALFSPFSNSLLDNSTL